MKLLKKYRTYTYTSLIFVLFIGLISNYHLFRRANARNVDEVINGYRTDIEDYAEKHNTLAPLMAVNSKFGQIAKITPELDTTQFNEIIKDTLAYDNYQEELIIYRKLKFYVDTADGKYLVQLMIPTVEQDYLVGTIVFSLLIFTVLFILFTSMIDLMFTQQIFSPFHKILEVMKIYNIEKHTKLELGKSNIDEFNDLSNILTTMMHKIDQSYYEMKDFLEFTSHELQTPLSIIQLKLETLNQKNFDDPEVLDGISSIQSSLRRVIRFNRSIFLIAKIKNNQYADAKLINFRILFTNYLKQYEELLQIKNITVDTRYTDSFRQNLHPLLAEHLAQNLLTNAIKHNITGGNITLTSSAHQLTLSNTFEGTIPSGNLFEKYAHSTDKRDSNGLGLAISKIICTQNKIDISYHVSGNIFTILLSSQ